MARPRTVLRAATTDDVVLLLELWSGLLRPGDTQEQAADLELVVKNAAASPEQRLLVAEVDGEPAGAVLLQVRQVSALDRRQVVEAVSPHVLPAHRGQGVGLMLVEAAVTFAEDLAIAFVGTATLASSREANRFMARLGLRPQAVLRVASTHPQPARGGATLPGQPPKRSFGTRAHVIRQVHSRLPRSSVTTISQVADVRPRWAGVAVPVTTPDVAERWCVALMSTPTASRSGWAWMAEPIEPRDSARAMDAPPWRSP